MLFIKAPFFLLCIEEPFPEHCRTDISGRYSCGNSKKKLPTQNYLTGSGECKQKCQMWPASDLVVHACGGQKCLPIHQFSFVIFTFSGLLGLLGSDI